MRVLASFPLVDVDELGVSYYKLRRLSWKPAMINEGLGSCSSAVSFSSRSKVSLSEMMVDLEVPDAVGLASHDNMVYQDKACVGL